MKGADERPIFVIGNPRSGTTLLRLMLAAHPDVFIPPEAGFAMWLYPAYRSWTTGDGLDRFLGELMETRKFHLWGVTRHELEQSLGSWQPEDYGALVAGVYRCFMAKAKPGARLWGDKNNTYLREIPSIKRLYPSACFIHIVRDGRNVAASYRELGRRAIVSEYAPDLPTGMEEIAAEWVGNLELVERSFAEFGNEGTTVVRLEDLTADAESGLTGVCDLLEIEFEPAMLRFHELIESRGGEPAEFLQWKEKITLPLQPPDEERYLEDLTPGEIRVFESAAGSVLSRYGYRVSGGPGA